MRVGAPTPVWIPLFSDCARGVAPSARSVMCMPCAMCRQSREVDLKNA
jgi:hypothetical protein